MTAVLVVAAVLLIAAAIALSRRGRTTIQPGYDEVTEQDDSFLQGDFPEQPDRTYRAVQTARRADRPSQMPMRRQP